MRGTIEHLPDPAEELREVYRILKKEKKYILSLGAVLYELENFEPNIEKTLAKIRNSIFHTSIEL